MTQNDSGTRTMITGLAYELGKLEPIEGLAKRPEDEDAINIMMATGLSTYSRSEQSVVEMAAASMRKTLAQVDIPLDEIEAVIFGTESFWDSVSAEHERETYRQFRRDIYKAIFSVGLKNAYPYGVMFSGCGNLISALSMASNMLKAQGLKNVLVVVSDRHPPARSRVMPPAVAIISDAAASCLVTSRPVNGYSLDQAIQHSNLKIHDVDIEDDFGRFLLEMAKSLKLTGARMHELTGRPPADYKRLLVNNYSLSTARVFSYQLGYELPKLFLDNVPRFSHAHSADILINLADLDATGGLKDGDRVMSLGSGPVTWGMMALSNVSKQSAPGR